MSEIDCKKCKYFPNENCIYNKETILNCEDCFYQQLQQLKQENEELKERIKCRCFDSKSNNNRCISYNRIADDYEKDYKQLQQLKQENEGLYKENDKFQGLYQDEHCDVLKLEQKLEKIKEIAQGMHDWWYNKSPYEDNYKLSEHLLECELKRILNELDESEE